MELKEKIQHESTMLFLRYGVKSVTMDDIAVHLGVSKKTIYTHFADKDELVLSCVKAHMDGQICTITEIQKNSKNPIEELVQTSMFMKSMFKNLNASLLFDLKKYYPSAYKVFEEHKAKNMLELIKSNIEKGQSLGLYRSEIDAIVLAKLRVQEIEFAFDIHVFPIDTYNQFDVQMQYFNHFVYGLMTQEGINLFENYLKKSENEN